MNITTKFAYTGLILSIFCVLPSVANANKKPIEVSSLKSCELQDSESESPCKNDSFATKYGDVVEIKNFPDSYVSSLFFKGKMITETDMSGWKEFVKLFHFKDSDVVFISYQSDAKYVPVNYFFLRITPDAKVKLSNPLDEYGQKYHDYDSYSNLDHPILKQDGDKITVDLGRNSEGSQEVATYQNNHISVKITKSKNGKLLAYEKSCKDTYHDEYLNINAHAFDPQIGRCFGTDWIDYSNSEVHGGYLLSDKLFKVIQYTCTTHKVIDYPKFKKFVCDGK